MDFAVADLSIALVSGRGMAAPDEPPFAWPDHPLAASGGEILATRILPLMGHNARDFARAAAVCRGWRAACRAAAATLGVYRETTLQRIKKEIDLTLAWTPCGKFIAAAVRDPPRFFIWRASTGALVKEWALNTPATAVPPDILIFGGDIRVAFSGDSARVLTHIFGSNHFAVWSVPDGQLLAVNRGANGGDCYQGADFGVPGSASDGLVGFGSSNGSIHLWDVSPPTEGRASRPRLRSRVNRAHGEESGSYIKNPGSFKFSPDGSKFAATYGGIAYVYDVASLTRLGAYTTPSNLSRASWVPNGSHALVSWDKSACVWDFSRPEAPFIVTADAGPGAHFRGWSPSGASYFAVRQLKGLSRSRDPLQRTLALEERGAADGSIIRDVILGPGGVGIFPRVCISPDARALVLHHLSGIPAPRVIVFD